MSKRNQIDQVTYERVKVYLKKSLEQMVAAGSNVKEFGKFSVEKFGDTIIPYLHAFGEDISNGQIKIKGLAKTARTAIFGRHVTSAEREHMIREVAYYRAESRGFSGGSVDEDWCVAEQLVDQQLAQETGLVENGRIVFNSIGTIVENELDEIRQVINRWLELNPGKLEPRKKVAPRKKASASHSTSAPAKKKTTTAKKKTATSKKKATTATKKTAKQTDKGKKAALKKAVKKKALAKK